ncbi:Uma2 family endonuclease [Pendulispora brunnea]|uniref:Uma2 family endonuclease n=1 Tax=Pendulispora brunnea TaxID=2905690 RepID=A0ABZ2KPB5_9BACT
MVAVAALQLEDEDGEMPVEDHFVHLDGVTWADYLRLLRIRGDHSAPRMTFCEGLLEIMSPSRHHESIKSLIGRLVEAFCLENDIEFSTYGSWTIKEKKHERGAEPDECYVIGRGPEGRMPKNPRRPDLAIEVVWTAGGINKLEVYRKLQVAEVWYWRRNRLQVYRLRREKYALVERSVVLANIDLALLVKFLDKPTTSQAIRDYRKALSKAK